MAVFTQVSSEEAQTLVTRLGLGRLIDLRGIQAGIENTNYFLNTECDGQRHAWVLTIFERLGFEQLPFYLHLMKHLAERGIPVPKPQAETNGDVLLRLRDKPAAVVNRLAGQHQLAPAVSHCEQVGAMLARMHVAGQNYAQHQPNLRGLGWWDETIPTLLPFLDEHQHALITTELAFQHSLAASAAYQALPRGPIHADLFRDNVMFDGPVGHERLSGFFDFYFAGVDAWLFDIAVCLNDWCIDLDSGRLDETRAQAFISAYDQERPLSHDEIRLLPSMLRAGALRFWTSRLWDFHMPREARLLKPHDPRHFERILRERIQNPWHWLR
ncbi:MAG: homoserine kinase [Leptothrix ochracea]|uniref:homoserine kinase n=1 Tax=Leptothrix ochracea TaxID=735331 RepID=UPI0034E29958